MRLPGLPLLAALVCVDLLASGLTWLGWEASGREGLARAIAVLLVASPFGVLIARYAPLPVSRRVGRRGGITYLGSTADQALLKVRQLVIEVDHVITTGHLVVVNVAPFDDRHKNDLRWFAGALAHGSTDPVARAVAKLAGLGRPLDVKQGPAHELQGAVDRHPVRIGADGVTDVDQVVGTTVRVDVDLRPMGHITVADEVRKNAARCIATLRDEGIEPILVSATLSEPDLARVAEQVGVEKYYTDTDAAAMVATLPQETTAVLRAVNTSDGAGASGLTGETMLPGGTNDDAVVRCANPSIGSALDSIDHVRGLRKSRHIAQGCAIAAVVAAVPLAATGILALTNAAVVVGVSLLVIAAVASVAVLFCSPEAARA